MESADELRLRKNYKLLVGSLLFSEIQDHFVSEGLFDEALIQTIKTEPSDEDKVRALLRELKRCGKKAYSTFYNAIKATGNNDHILSALDNTNVEEAMKPIDSSDDSGFLRLKDNYKRLVDCVRYCDVRDQLFQDGVLDDHNAETIDKMKEKTETEKMRVLLQVILRQGSAGYTSLHEALSAHARYGDILEELKKTDVDQARRKYGRNAGDANGNFVNGESDANGNCVRAPVHDDDLVPAFQIISNDFDCMRHWKQFRVLPGIQEADVYIVEHTCRMNNDDPRECLYQLLLSWRQKRGSQASLKDIEKVLEDLRLRKTLATVRKRYETGATS